MKYPRGMNRDIRALLVASESAGATVRKTGSGHYQVVTPAGNIVVVSGTPGSWRSVTNDRAQLRRAGIPV
jgi:hypothetical protein